MRLTQVILRVASRCAPGEFSAADVLERVGKKAKKGSVRTMLGQLTDDGRLERVRRGRYRLPLGP